MNLCDATADVLVSKIRACSEQKAISFWNAKTWKELPLDVQQAPSPSIFKEG